MDGDELMVLAARVCMEVALHNGDGSRVLDDARSVCSQLAEQELVRKQRKAIRKEKDRDRKRTARGQPADIPPDVHVESGQKSGQTADKLRKSVPSRNLNSSLLSSEEKQEAKQSQDLRSSSSPSELLSAEPSKLLQLPARAAWTAYATGYRRRYGIAPVRNAKVNGQLAQFVRRIPAADVVATIMHYVGSQNARYVASGHSVGCLLQDAEKLHTEALTGRQGTAAAARRVDKTADRTDQYAEMLDRLGAEDDGIPEVTSG